MVSPAIALDRASIRTKDADGRLHVGLTPITKAAINPYYGREIPGSDKLGLDPGKVYRLFRDPKEIEKAAATFNRLPLLATHVPASAGDHPTDEVVGSTGEQAAFDGTYLKNSLVVWRQDAIDGVEDGDQKELSCGYRYVPDMTPGEWNGEPYDGRMTNIVGNHVALVREGRAGPDVVVGDAATVSRQEAAAASGLGAISQPAANERTTHMAKTPVVLSRTAALANGAIISVITPKLATDAKLPDIKPILAGLTAGNFKSKKAGVLAGLTKALSGKLAKDATLDEVSSLLDKLDPAEAGEPEAPKEDDPVEMLRALSDDPEKFRAAVEALVKSAKPAEDEDNEAEDEDAPEAKKDEGKEAPKASDEEKTKDDEPKVTKSAMDAAIAKVRAEAVKAGAAEAMRRANAVRAAERKVEPVVGVMQGAFDSAGDVYKAALEMRSVDVTGVSDPVALERMFDMEAKHASAPRSRPAMDAKLPDDFSKRFPNANRLKAAI